MGESVKMTQISPHLLVYELSDGLFTGVSPERVRYLRKPLIEFLSVEVVPKLEEVLAGSKTQYIGKKWASKRGTREVVGVSPDGRLLVKTDGSRFNELIEPNDLELTIQIDESRAESIQEFQKKSKQEKEQKEIEQDVFGFGEELAPYQKAKVVKTLNQIKTLSGKAQKLKDHIKERINQGWVVRYYEGSKYPNRFESPDGNFFTDKDVTKTGMDLARYLASNQKLKPDLEIIKVTNLSQSAVEFVADQFSAFQTDGSPEGEDHFVRGKTFVETTRRVLEGALQRLDVEDLVIMAVGSVFNEREIPIVERSARRSALTTQEKLRAALEGRKPRKIKASEYS